MINKPDIVETILNSGIDLKRKGRYFFALCPFHMEKNPSFSVNPVRQTFCCFGCGEKGDGIAFIQKYKSLSFKEAIAYLGINNKPARLKEVKRRELIQAFRRWCDSQYNDLCLLYRTLQKLKATVRTIEEVEALADSYHKESSWLWQLDILFGGSDEEKFHLYKELKT